MTPAQRAHFRARLRGQADLPPIRTMHGFSRARLAVVAWLARGADADLRSTLDTAEVWAWLGLPPERTTAAIRWAERQHLIALDMPGWRLLLPPDPTERRHHAMSTPTKTDPTPPRDYGNGDTWADDGPWAVPEELRPFYAEAEPTPDQTRGYIANGIDVAEEVTYPVTRVVDPGDATRRPRVVEEESQQTVLRPWRGAENYREFLHLVRMRSADKARARAQTRVAIESHWSRCSVCGIRNGGVRSTRVDGTPQPTVTGCSEHLPLLLDAANTNLTERRASQQLADGRTVGEVAAADVAALLDGTEAPS